MPDITGDRPDCGGTRRKRVFPCVCKADRQIVVAFGSGLNATTRGPQWSHPSYPLLVSVDGAHVPPPSCPPRRPPRCTAEDSLAAPAREVLSRKSRARPRTTEATRPRAHDHVAMARWQKRCQCHCDYRPMRLCGRTLLGRVWDSRSFFFFSSYFSLSLSRIALSWRPIEFTARSATVATFPRTRSRVTSRRLSETHAYETCHTSFLWKETRSVQVRPSLGQTAVSRTGTRSSVEPLRFEVSRKSFPF